MVNLAATVNVAVTHVTVLALARPQTRASVRADSVQIAMPTSAVGAWICRCARGAVPCKPRFASTPVRGGPSLQACGIVVAAACSRILFDPHQLASISFSTTDTISVVAVVAGAGCVGALLFSTCCKSGAVAHDRAELCGLAIHSVADKELVAFTFGGARPSHLALGVVMAAAVGNRAAVHWGADLPRTLEVGLALALTKAGAGEFADGVQRAVTIVDITGIERLALFAASHAGALVVRFAGAMECARTCRVACRVDVAIMAALCAAIDGLASRNCGVRATESGAASTRLVAACLEEAVGIRATDVSRAPVTSVSRPQANPSVSRVPRIAGAFQPPSH